MAQLFTSSIVIAMLWLGGLACGAPQEGKQPFARSYQAYLNKSTPVSFDKIEVTRTHIEISARITNRVDRGNRVKFPRNELAIALFPTHLASQRDVRPEHLLPAKVTGSGSRILAKIGRYSAVGKNAGKGRGMDRATARLMLVRRTPENRLVPLTAATYPNRWSPEVPRKLERLVANGKKGLGGIPRDSFRDNHQIYQLGISHATVNVVLNSLIDDHPRPGFRDWVFEGQTVYLNEPLLKQFDKRLVKMREQNIVASAILLVGNRRPKTKDQSSESIEAIHPLIHPEASPDAKFAMPNLSQPKGALLYRAIMTKLAERFSRPGDQAGRISNWIMHNEVDHAGTWTSMGPQSIERYLETYMRSVRVVHQTTRTYNPHARTFISLTHFWNKVRKQPEIFQVRQIVDLFNRVSKVEGDFLWGVAYHPYPANLREPKTWQDQETTFQFDTPLITPRNIEVLPAYLSQRRLRFCERDPRPILLSEQGANARSLSQADQQLQAASLVYMYFRMRQLTTVEAFHYHAYRDSPKAEGGLRLGLVTEDHQEKFAFGVYQALDTPAEQDTVRFAWDLMGRSAARDAKRLYKVTPAPRVGVAK